MQPPAPQPTLARQLALACQGKTPTNRREERSYSKEGSSSHSVKTPHDDFTAQDERDFAAIQAQFDANHPELADDTTDFNNNTPTLTNTPESTQRREKALCSRSSNSDDDQVSRMMDEGDQIFAKHFKKQPEKEIKAFFDTMEDRQQELNQINDKWNPTEAPKKDEVPPFDPRTADEREIDYDAHQEEFLRLLHLMNQPGLQWDEKASSSSSESN